LSLRVNKQIQKSSTEEGGGLGGGRRAGARDKHKSQVRAISRRVKGGDDGG